MHDHSLIRSNIFISFYSVIHYCVLVSSGSVSFGFEQFISFAVFKSRSSDIFRLRFVGAMSGARSVAPDVSVVDPMAKEREQILAALKQLIGVEGIPIPALLLIIASYAVTFVSTVSSIRLNPALKGVYSLCWAGVGSKDWMGSDSDSHTAYRISPDGMTSARDAMRCDAVNHSWFHHCCVFRSYDGRLRIG